MGDKVSEGVWNVSGKEGQMDGGGSGMTRSDNEGGSSKIYHFLVTLFLNGSLSNEFDQICWINISDSEESMTYLRLTKLVQQTFKK